MNIISQKINKRKKIIYAKFGKMINACNVQLDLSIETEYVLK
jgi:hypothetical protein